MSTIYSFDYNQNKEDERDESCSDDEIYLLINKSQEDSSSESEVGIQIRKKWKATLISESFEESQTDNEIINPKRRKKSPLINDTPKLENDSKVMNPKMKTKPPLINETQEQADF